MGFYSNQTLSYTSEDAELDRRDGPTLCTPRFTRIDPMIAQAAPFRTDDYSIYYCAPVADPTSWQKKHSGSFATYEQAQRAMKRLGWLHGNGMHYCIIPAVAETLSYPIGLELLYGRAA
jgi:hypothetical protein